MYQNILSSLDVKRGAKATLKTTEALWFPVRPKLPCYYLPSLSLIEYWIEDVLWSMSKIMFHSKY